MYNQRKTEAEEAEKVLVSLRAKYQKIQKQKNIIEVEQYRYYQEDYKELLKEMQDYERRIRSRNCQLKEEIIDIYRAIMQENI